MSRIAVIVVTHNSKAVIGRCLVSLEYEGNGHCGLIIVDSGSRDSRYLAGLEKKEHHRVVISGNIGFSRANNAGYLQVDQGVDYVVFLNPDAFPGPGTFKLASEIMEDEPNIGCLTGRLLGFDLEEGHANGRIDSTGIFRKWYGRWYDRGQGEMDAGQYAETEEIEAACGAFMFCRKTALDEAAVNGDIFDPDFFLYKEDIELSLRLRRGDWRIVYHPSLWVYHCRGWQVKRNQVPYKYRKMSARNEIMLYQKHPSPFILWALFKYLLVSLFRV